MDSEQHYCSKCNKTLNKKEFYKSKNLEKYPDDGCLDQCKKCLTMHLDNWDPSTFIWILQELDIPYIKEVWNGLLEKFAKNPEKITGMTILGRYISQMKLSQWKKYRWADTEKIQEKKENEQRAVMKAQGYDDETIDSAIQKNREFLVDRPPDLFPPEGRIDPQVSRPEDNSSPSPQPQEQEFIYEDDEEELDIKNRLTEDDIIYLKLKWGKGYKPSEWVHMEQLYEDMKASYDIQGAGHEDTLKLICKTSLKANQLIDRGDFDAYQKVSRIYDLLMKSGKFTAAQNKGVQGEFVDSIGELVALCEKEGFIPRYVIDAPNDKVDKTLEDLKTYTRTLVSEELNLGNLVENAVQNMLKEENKPEDEDITESEELFEYNIYTQELQDKDHEDLKRFEDVLSEEDLKLLEGFDK